MPESHHVVKSSLSFAKLVATPTDMAWSQAYNAGNLFACLSLTVVEKDETIFLQALGKDTFSLLQSEFFSLEDKTVDAIKQAITKSLANIPPTVTVSLTLANFKDNLLTIFIVGSGKVVMKRDEKIGTLLDKKTAHDNEITSAAGYLENADTIVLQTGAFAKGTSQETVAGALELALPNDIVESLSPQMHEQDNGAQAAIVVSYHAGTPHQLEEKTEEESEEQKEPTIEAVYKEAEEERLEHHEVARHEEEEEENDDDEKEKKPFLSRLPTFHFPQLPHGKGHITHRQKLYLSVAVILFILLGASVFFTIKKQSDAKQQALFQSIYEPAKQDYEEGQALESFGRSHDSYIKAETRLKTADGKISKGSAEDNQIQELLGKVESALHNSSSGETAAVTETTAPANSLLAVAKDTTSGKAFGQDTNNVYVLSSTAVSSVSKSSGSKKDIIKNDNAWSNPQSVVPYEGNIFVLDQKSVLKYVAGGDGFAKSSYFTGGTPDLSQATGMAIDGSIWIVSKDGKILKYTKGKQDSFTLSGLDAPLQKPTRIATDITMDNIYILDNGSGRIVQFDKNGTYKKAYSAAIIAKATEFDVDEKGKTILILSGNKVWELAL